MQQRWMRPLGAARCRKPTTANTTSRLKPSKKAIRKGLEEQVSARRTARDAIRASEEAFELTESVAELEEQMLEAAQTLEFGKAARLRDRIKRLEGIADVDPAARQKVSPAQIRQLFARRTFRHALLFESRLSEVLASRRRRDALPSGRG